MISTFIYFSYSSKKRIRLQNRLWNLNGTELGSCFSPLLACLFLVLFLPVDLAIAWWMVLNFSLFVFLLASGVLGQLKRPGHMILDNCFCFWIRNLHLHCYLFVDVLSTFYHLFCKKGSKLVYKSSCHCPSYILVIHSSLSFSYRQGSCFCLQGSELEMPLVYLLAHQRKTLRGRKNTTNDSNVYKKKYLLNLFVKINHWYLKLVIGTQFSKSYFSCKFSCWFLFLGSK